MNNPWKDFSNTAPFIAPIDTPYIERYNAHARPEHKLHTNVMPAPFTGGLNSARVILLALNPGYDEKDNLRMQNTRFRQAICENLKDPVGYKKFTYLENRFSHLNDGGNIIMDPGYEWWSKRTRELVEYCGPINGCFMCLEWFPYPSVRFQTPTEIFPSQKFTFELLREAIRQRKLIVILRSKKIWIQSVPELQTYDRILELKSAQSIYLTRNNIKDEKFDLLVSEMNK